MILIDCYCLVMNTITNGRNAKEMTMMLEQTLEQMSATIFVADSCAKAVSENGYAISRGSLHLTFADAVELIANLDRLFCRVPKYQQKRFKSFRNQVVYAFGPDMEEYLSHA